MKRPLIFGKLAPRAFGRVFSVPLFFKIMGIGLVVGAVFGGTTLLQIRGPVWRALHQTLEDRARSIAQSLVASLERPLSTGDLFSVDQKLQRTRQMFPNVRYIIIRDAQGRIVSHTFERAVPTDLAVWVRPSVASGEELQVLASGEGLIFDVTRPILDGHAGMLKLGVTDQMITQELSAVTRSVLGSLGLCTMIGTGLTLLLTHILTRPVHHLVQAAKRVRDGDFRARSEVFSSDEIGRLAVAFNQMTDGLQRYHREIRDKERARILLIDQIVRTQEEERKSISRELHDQLGQSLLALLLAVQSLCKDNQVPEGLCHDVQSRIRQLIEEVHQLAWGMRPSILDDYGLDSALARHTEEIAERFHLAIDYQYTRSPRLGRLPSQIEVALYRIAQEAILNILRHAHATQTSTVVLQRRDEVTLLVEDNGRGFDVEATQRSGADCLGLTGMRERSALLGGTCAVESMPERGTTIRISIPLNEDGTCQSEL